MNRSNRALPALCAPLALLGGCYTVNSTVDAPDANPGDGVCARALTAAERRSGLSAAPSPGDAARRALQRRVDELPPSWVARAAARVQSRGDPVDALEAEVPRAPPALAAAAADAKAALQARRAQPGPVDDLAQRIPLCTLRAAVMEANAHAWKSYIEVPAGVYALTLPPASGGAGGPLEVRGSMRIQGRGPGETIVDAQGSSTVFYVAGNSSQTDIEINHLRIRHGDAGGGGGLYLARGSIELEHLDIRDNTAFTGGAGMYVHPDATVSVRRTTFANNVAIGLAGGGIWNQGQLRVYDSTLVDNQSNRAGAIHNGATGQLNLRNVTVSRNRADVDDPGGASGTGGIHQAGFAVLNNVTVTGNEGTSDRAGGLYMTTGSTTVMRNSILAGNEANGGPDDCAGTLSFDSQYNLVGNSSGCVIPGFVATYVLDQPAQLGALASNGGPTQTHQPLPGSPALDVAYASPPPAAIACEARDQRGVPRAQGAGGCDIGAVEVTASSGRITGFMLVDATTDTDIRPLLHDDWVLADQLPDQWTIRAVTAGAVESVVFDLDDDAAVRIENSAPYALSGDAGGDYAPLGLPAGEHSLTATPQASDDGGGAAGASSTIRFTVFDS